MVAKKGQLFELLYEERRFEVIVIDPNGVGKGQPSIGFGFGMMERHGGFLILRQITGYRVSQIPTKNA